MDQVYIDALVQQALGAYKAGGDAGLEHWKQALPAHNLKEFERDCSKPLQEAIEKLQAEWAGQTFPLDEDATQPSDTRKKHTRARDPRRTKPL